SEGALKLEDIPIEKLNEKQNICLEVLKTKKPYINSAGVQNEISSWKFPLIFLDFETINPAIPRYIGTGPFTQVPFQFSVHILNSIDSETTHHEFLYDQNTDPRADLIPELINACKGEGSVVAYYGQFESARIQDLEEFAPNFKNELKHIRDRIVDPLPIFREHIYFPEFTDSYSIKSVGPAVLGDEFSYEHMKVGDGSAAQRAFEELISPTTSGPRKEELRLAMLEYCKKDTLVMVELVKWLYKC
ncbi:MAG: DUF2779 domain-containing protein, partial [Pseudobdellovibrio sp.]